MMQKSELAAYQDLRKWLHGYKPSAVGYIRRRVPHALIAEHNAPLMDRLFGPVLLCVTFGVSLWCFRIAEYATGSFGMFGTVLGLSAWGKYRHWW